MIPHQRNPHDSHTQKATTKTSYTGSTRHPSNPPAPTTPLPTPTKQRRHCPLR
jgi:hypothetical protein